jgi:ribose 5-phosphate isomerase B
MVTISLGSDHGGLEYKNAIRDHLVKLGYNVIDVGTDCLDSCHYPEFGLKAAELVGAGEAKFGIVVCTSGEGISMAANKVKGVRCGIAYNDEVTRFMRLHNDANMIAFGQKYMSLSDVLFRVDLFLNTEFEGGRHATRVQMIKDYENK